MKDATKLVAVLGLILGAAGQARADLIVNGSFEADSWTANNGVSPSGWTTVLDPAGRFPIGYNNSVGNGSSRLHTPFGSQFLVLGALDDNAVDSIRQTVMGLTVGSTYTLGFDQSPEVANSQFGSNIGATISDGVNSNTTPFRIVSNDGSNWAHWFHHDLTFTATNVAETIKFQGIAVDPGGLNAVESGLDNITLTANVTATPEPSTLVSAGMAGLMGLGYAWRRRKAKPAT